MATSEPASCRDLLKKYLETRDSTHFKAAFQLLDQDGDGLLSPQDFLVFPIPGQSLEKAQAEAEKILRIGDSNKDGFLDEKEFGDVVLGSYFFELIEEEARPPDYDHFQELMCLYGTQKT